MGAELVSALAGRGARRTAPALTFRSLSPGSHRTPGSGLIPVEGSGDISVLRSPAFSKGLGQRSGCFKNKAWSLQRLCCWSDKADSPSVVAGSHGAANHMVELGGRRSWAPCSPADPGNSFCESPWAPCAGWPARGACMSLPRGQPSAQSRPPEHGQWLSLRRDDGLWVSSCREDPAAQLLWVGGWVQCRGEDPTTTAPGLHEAELVLLCAAGPPPSRCPQAPSSPPRPLHFTELEGGQRPARFAPIPTPTLPFLAHA